MMGPAARVTAAFGRGGAAGVLFSGALAGRLIGLAAMPAVTRLYGPADFGLLAVFSAMVMVLSPALALRLEEGVALLRSDCTAFALLAAAALVAEARESYDLVVIDTPPAGIVADARVIARVADAVLHVVAWNRTPRARVAEALRPFAGLRGGVSGLVLTQVDPQRLHRYGYEAGCGDYGAGAGYYSG